MVRFTSVLSRVPVIKFRKGGLGAGSAPAAASSALPKKLGGCPIGRAPPAAPMSTLPDVDLPARYKRRPLSQEEIDHINGGGIV